ncbi:hypothetical protein Tco_0779319, partial [Tanacetum coccineum]
YLLGRLYELKKTIDVGLLHRGNSMETIRKQYEQWSDLVRREARNDPPLKTSGCIYGDSHAGMSFCTELLVPSV